MTKEDIVPMLEYYAERNVKTISTKDFNNIFRLYSFKPEYLKDEMLKRLSQKTILSALL